MHPTNKLPSIQVLFYRALKGRARLAQHPSTQSDTGQAGTHAALSLIKWQHAEPDRSLTNRSGLLGLAQSDNRSCTRALCPVVQQA